MHCQNCSAELFGEYCHACGQHVLHNPDLNLRPFVRQFGRELLQLDFKTVHSLRALFKPGFLTKEFLDGRRRRYLSPLKVYFVAAGIFFLLAPSVGFSLEDLLRSDSGDMLTQMVTTRAQARSMDMDLFTERFDLRIQTTYTLSLSVSIIVAAAVLRALVRTHTLGMHMVFAVHYVAFLYFGALALGAIEKITDLPSLGMLALTYAINMPYLFIAMRRVYEPSRARTTMNVLVLCLVTFFVDNLVNFAALLLTLWLV